MALRRRGSGGHGEMNAWPGYVDALSTLLMVIIFVLLVFILGQAFLSLALTGRDQALDRMNRRLSELSDMLSLERGRSTELTLSVASLNRDAAAAGAARDTLAQQLAAVRDVQTRTLAERDTLRGERDTLTARLADADLRVQAQQARNENLQVQLGESIKRTDVASNDAAANAAKAVLTARALAEAQARIADLQRQQAELDRSVQVGRDTIAARLSDLARLQVQTSTLVALRDDLQRQVADAAARATTEAERRAALTAALGKERDLSETARAQLAVVNRQIEELRSQMASVQQALTASEAVARDKDVQIVNLGSRLNAALAAKVEELQRYRSDFFGRLREVLANRPGIQVVGDRFVFQSEVLFPVASADLTLAGWEQIKALAETLKGVIAEIPPDVNWLLRVDGHADRQPVLSNRFASNWELSASRAITVVKLLVGEGVPADRLAATGFGDNQPLDARDAPDAYARNRRIELRLTDR